MFFFISNLARFGSSDDALNPCNTNIKVVYALRAIGKMCAVGEVLCAVMNLL
jgi:hypothetical protein